VNWNNMRRGTNKGFGKAMKRLSNNEFSSKENL
jgi:hypothetical protein